MSLRFYNYANSGSPSESSAVPGPGGHSLEEMFLCMWGYPHVLHCNQLIRGYDLAAHLREVHGIRGSGKLRVVCKWEHCCLELNKASLAGHVEETHMGIAYSCECGKMFSRRDTLKKHRKTCTEQYVDPGSLG
ncbi:uncharacterized protein EDB91DRAFT_1111292 [Suillus paluster]|uniref:uncharacterized protein n=1 Tax=Suillus paluster TaxID=48578 RepID=UPI001B875774|nr:uncharacterized protein EDB91DRAFT_1111292 [Suillus paluster]KAG1748898.1 hypothetical protein EDB91DRAFT_1111292 [Suillus paluster]